ncbi:hypothetical protein Fmac_026749 [Flemingia macrophylla]|uniref:Uncharacterized protein n=1 Tax=Flemingia macrophylla TaxID=520843 RepID=A0ABD1LHH1_9FABA
MISLKGSKNLIVDLERHDWDPRDDQRVRVRRDNSQGSFHGEVDGKSGGLRSRAIVVIVLCVQWLEDQRRHHKWRQRVRGSGTRHCAEKVVGTLVTATTCRVPARETMTLAMLMNTKGLVEIIVLNIGSALVSSLAGQVGIYGYMAYSTNKFGLRGLVEAFRVLKSVGCV